MEPKVEVKKMEMGLMGTRFGFYIEGEYKGSAGTKRLAQSTAKEMAKKIAEYRASKDSQ